LTPFFTTTTFSGHIHHATIPANNTTIAAAINPRPFDGAPLLAALRGFLLEAPSVTDIAEMLRFFSSAKTPERSSASMTTEAFEPF
jgi:hypothetical protein